MKEFLISRLYLLCVLVLTAVVVRSVFGPPMVIAGLTDAAWSPYLKTGLVCGALVSWICYHVGFAPRIHRVLAAQRRAAADAAAIARRSPAHRAAAPEANDADAACRPDRGTAADSPNHSH